MRGRCLALQAVMLAWLLGVAGPASAQPRFPDFTFVVPVQLTNLHPNVTFGTVRCDVYASGQIAPHWLYDLSIDEEGRPGNTGQDYIGHGQAQQVPVVNRQLNTTFSVPVMADAGKDPGKARLYRCLISLQANPDGQYTTAGSPVALYVPPHNSDLRFLADSNQPHRLAVAGTIAPPPKALEKKPELKSLPKEQIRR